MSEFDLDAAALVLDVMRIIAERLPGLGDKVNASSGTFTLECPKCKGTLRVAWAKHPRRRSRQRQSYAAVCDTTEGCLKFMGH